MGYYINNVTYTPLKGVSKLKVTSGYGKRTYYDKYKKKNITDIHNGIDLTGGDTVISFMDGVVTSTRDSIKGYSSKYSKGNYVTIKHDNGLISSYMHLKYKSVKVTKGDKVKMGDIIGTVGSTGNSMSPHLHFAIKKGNKWVNPEDYLKTSNKEEKYYIVKKEDNLSKIAKKYNTTWQKLYEINKDIIGNNPNLIKIGIKLKVSE